MNLLLPFFLLLLLFQCLHSPSNQILVYLWKPVALIFSDKPSFPAINFMKNLLQVTLQLESCYSIKNPTLYLSITYNCHSKLNSQGTSRAVPLPVCHRAAYWDSLITYQRRMCGKNNGDSPAFSSCSVYIWSDLRTGD